MKPKESALYPDVRDWFKGRLKAMYVRAEVNVYDTSRFRLSNFLERAGLREAFEGSEAFEIEVDITATLRTGRRMELAFVECKTGPITLKDIGQILGYSRVASPTLSLIVSPQGLSSSVGLLLQTYNRIDLLEYGRGRRLKVGIWDLERKQVDPVSVIPPGELG